MLQRLHDPTEVNTQDKESSMAKFINVATIGGMVMERGEESPDEPLRQFREAAQNWTAPVSIL